MIVTDYRTLNLQSMDILLCSGNGGLSNKIKWFQKLTGAPEEQAQISHVAGVSQSRSVGDLWAQESTTFNKWCNKKGVQENQFSLWLENYNGKVWVRKLDFERTRAFYKMDENFWKLHQDEPYENGIPGYVELLFCGLMLNEKIKKYFPNFKPFRTKNPHCTELQALRLIWHDLLMAGVDVNRLPPWLFWSEIDKYIKCPIGKPIRIK